MSADTIYQQLREHLHYRCSLLLTVVCDYDLFWLREG